MQIEQIKKQESDEVKWVFDASVDHKGRVPLRASTGTWKASLFIIGIEFHKPWHEVSSGYVENILSFINYGDDH